MRVQRIPITAKNRIIRQFSGAAGWKFNVFPPTFSFSPLFDFFILGNFMQTFASTGYCEPFFLETNIIWKKKSWEILCGNNFMGNIMWGILYGPRIHGNWNKLCLGGGTDGKLLAKLFVAKHQSLKVTCNATGWSKKTVNCNLFLTDLNITKKYKTQPFLERAHREVLIFWCLKRVGQKKSCFSTVCQKWLSYAIFCQFQICQKEITIHSLFGSPCSTATGWMDWTGSHLES